MKKILLAVLVLVMLAGAALAQETAGFSFATLGDAMASESYTGIAGGDDQHFNVVVTLNGAPHRLTADLDDKARELAESRHAFMESFLSEWTKETACQDSGNGRNLTKNYLSTR